MSPSDRPRPPNTGKAPEGPDPDDPPSEEELRAAEALRRVLEGHPPGPPGGRERAVDAGALADAELAQSLRAAASPKALSPERHRQILDVAVAPRAPQAAAREGVAPLGPPKSKVVYFAFGGAAGVLAMAAAVALVIRGAAPSRPLATKALAERGGPALAYSRSAAELFPEGIPRSGGTTDRVDRIAYARAQDFRQNHFARWGAP
jgi:hypothetical protein